MLVSVIIPTYNRAGTIERTLKSVLSQTLPSLEVIVVDDGSTDRTAEVLLPYRDRIHLIRQDNQGPSAAKNSGIKAATGDILAFLDSDDCWLPDKLERQVRLLERTSSAGVTCCVCNATMRFGARATTSFEVARLYPKLREGLWSNPADVIADRFLLFNQVVAIRRSALEEVGFFREDLPYGPNEDYDYALRLSVLGPWSFIADPLVLWEEHGNNMSGTFSQKELCFHTLRIFEDLRSSARWKVGSRRVVLQRRLRHLRHEVKGLHLSTESNGIRSLFGRLLLLYLRVWGAVYRRLPLSPRMITQPARSMRKPSMPGTQI